MRLTEVVLEIEKHAAESGWDQPPMLYALVETADLVRREPAVAAQLGLTEATLSPGALTPVEQGALPTDRPLDEILAGIAWPAEVLGCAVVQEVLLLPPEAAADAPEGSAQEAAAWAAAHPQRQEVRLAVGVLRDGSRDSALRIRGHEADEDVLSGPELAPNLAEALADTLAD